jgi:hypothetical protein
VDFTALHNEVQLCIQIKSMPVGEEFTVTISGHQEESEARDHPADGEEAELDFDAIGDSVGEIEAFDIQLCIWTIEDRTKSPIKMIMQLCWLQRSLKDGKLRIDVEELASRIRINVRRRKCGNLERDEDVWTFLYKGKNNIVYAHKLLTDGLNQKCDGNFSSRCWG